MNNKRNYKYNSWHNFRLKLPTRLRLDVSHYRRVYDSCKYIDFEKCVSIEYPVCKGNVTEKDFKLLYWIFITKNEKSGRLIIRVKVKCSQCGKEILTTFKKYHKCKMGNKDEIYCSRVCEELYELKELIGDIDYKKLMYKLGFGAIKDFKDFIQEIINCGHNGLKQFIEKGGKL
jgi:hypothetical protein